MSASANPDIVTDGLVLCLDASDRKSYSGNGTTWYDRSGNGTMERWLMVFRGHLKRVV